MLLLSSAQGFQGASGRLKPSTKAAAQRGHPSPSGSLVLFHLAVTTQAASGKIGSIVIPEVSEICAEAPQKCGKNCW